MSAMFLPLMKQLLIVGTKARWIFRFGFLAWLVFLSCAAFGQERVSPEARAHMIEMEQRMALAKPFLDRAEQHYYAGRLSDANEECQRAILMYQSIGTGMTSYAMIMQSEIDLALNRVPEAVQRLEEVRVERGPGMRIGRLLVALVVGYARLGSASLAQQSLDELLLDDVTGDLRRNHAWADVVRLRTGVARSWEALALSVRAMELSGSDKKAIYYLSRAVELAPDNPGVRLLYGTALRWERRWQEAKSQLQRAAQATGPSAEKARLLLKQGALPPPIVG